jgi:hypothetical protein
MRDFCWAPAAARQALEPQDPMAEVPLMDKQELETMCLYSFGIISMVGLPFLLNGRRTQ